MIRCSSGGPGWLTTISNPDPDDLWRLIIRIQKGTLVQFCYDARFPGAGSEERYRRHKDEVKPGWHVGTFLKTGMHMDVPSSGRGKWVDEGGKKDVDWLKADKFGTRWFLVRDQLRDATKPFSIVEAEIAADVAGYGFTTVNIDLGTVTVFQVNMRV